jgi:hypothetical protein
MLTRRDVLKLAGIPIATAAPQAWAAPLQFWEAKPPAEWSADEARRMLTESPWARAAVVRDAAVADAAGGGRLSPAAQQWNALPKKTRHWRVTVRWESSAPIQAALSPASARDSTNDEFERYYVISVVGDTRVTGFLVDDPKLGDTLGSMRLNSTLEPANAAPLRVEKLEEVSHESQRALRFYFPRRRPITPGALHLYFATTIGRFEVMAKFDVNDMLYGGKLAL